MTWQNNHCLYFFLDLLHKKEVWESVTSHSYIPQDVTVIMSHDRSHDEYGKIVYRPYSSCISNV